MAEWKKTKINILDTPGYNIFINDTRASLAAADAVVTLTAGAAQELERRWGRRADVMALASFSLPLGLGSITECVAAGHRCSRIITNESSKRFLNVLFATSGSLTSNSAPTLITEFASSAS